MSGKRLLDAIQLLNVSKSVAVKHLAIRQHQLDVYTRTSRCRTGAPLQRTLATAQPTADGRLPEPSPDSANAPNTTSTTTTPPSDEARKLQRQAEFQVPSSAAQYKGDEKPDALNVSQQQDVFYEPSQQSAPDLSALPRVKFPKATGDVQVGSSDGLNADVFHSSVDPDVKQSTPDQRQELPEEMMQGLFHSPRVSRMLSGKPAPKRDWLPVDKQPPCDQSAPSTTPSETVAKSGTEEMEKLGTSVAEDVAPSAEGLEAGKKNEVYQMMESRVPSSRLGRLWQYGGLATSMAFGAVGETVRRATGSQENGSLMFSAGNMERLVSKLSKMRGAALKLGQMLSFQDSKMLPDPIQQVLQRVQDRADYMPASQRDKVLTENLGPNWRDLFASFDEVPMAAASIGQVHAAVLKRTGKPVAVKVQYPGVADSIDSDLNNLSILLTASRLLPRGLYLDKTIANARTELAWECDYKREAEGAARFRGLLRDDPVFVVPEIITEASGKQVLTMEMLEGIAVTKIQDFSQEQRDWIGTQIMRLCLREITEFRYMQTDPNWTNFLYNARTNRLELLDFGASREYPTKFISTYVRTLVAAARNDRAACHTLSIQLGYLTGLESTAMADAHVSSILAIAEPFMLSSPDLYDFRDQTITDRVRDLIPLMIRERLAPPPEETYSLHRKLSGAFLLCARLGSRVPCKDLFATATRSAEDSGLLVDQNQKQ
ncbi:Protein ABC1 [Penicillium alfredii]|uniref:Protein ABC1 n=1 Tax=Penicillium alfredii TaxID=1506179 RepID=A0A9W9F2G8_9EURO|nr:Protein ABC1 [Penicillium alfredii]KAJ5092346.1 Protein ABC1 [Penicillium alfredii]